MQLTTLLLAMYFMTGNGQSQNLHDMFGIDMSKQMVTIETTAYYGPMKSEKNYKEAIKMNGKGLRTKSGTIPNVPSEKDFGTLSAETKNFPMGTKLYIPGYGLGKVEDTGGKIKGHCIDLYMGKGPHARKLAKKWGRQKIIALVM